MRNASCNVFGIPHFIRATDAHIAVAIYFLLTPTTLRLTHIRHQAITFLFLIFQVWPLFRTTLKRLHMILLWIPLSFHDLQTWDLGSNSSRETGSTTRTLRRWCQPRQLASFSLYIFTSTFVSSISVFLFNNTILLPPSDIFSQGNCNSCFLVCRICQKRLLCSCYGQR